MSQSELGDFKQFTVGLQGLVSDTDTAGILSATVCLREWLIYEFRLYPEMVLQKSI